MTQTNEQIQALKTAAESAIQAHGDDWFETGTQVCTVHKSKISLIAAANPTVILSLLAEREADKALVAELQRKLIHREFLLESADQVQKEYAEALGCAGDNESIMEAIGGLQDQVRTIDMSNGVLSARIAEMEARALTVKLPLEYLPKTEAFWSVMYDLMHQTKRKPHESWNVSLAFSEAKELAAWLNEVMPFRDAAGITLVVGGE